MCFSFGNYIPLNTTIHTFNKNFIMIGLVDILVRTYSTNEDMNIRGSYIIDSMYFKIRKVLSTSSINNGTSFNKKSLITSVTNIHNHPLNYVSYEITDFTGTNKYNGSTF